MKNLKVLKDNVLVKSSKDSSSKQSSIFVDTQAADFCGLIVAIGEDYEGSLAIGDFVYYGNKIQKVTIRNEKMDVMAADNIVAVDVVDTDDTKKS
jgi:co-chaperonin GroES (HSP10)